MFIVQATECRSVCDEEKSFITLDPGDVSGEGVGLPIREEDCRRSGHEYENVGASSHSASGEGQMRGNDIFVHQRADSLYDFFTFKQR